MIAQHENNYYECWMIVSNLELSVWFCYGLIIRKLLSLKNSYCVCTQCVWWNAFINKLWNAFINKLAYAFIVYFLHVNNFYPTESELRKLLHILDHYNVIKVKILFMNLHTCAFMIINLWMHSIHGIIVRLVNDNAHLWVRIFWNTTRIELI